MWESRYLDYETEVRMNKFIGKQAYQQTVQAPVINDPHGAITVCLNTLLQGLQFLSRNNDRASETAVKTSSKCLTAVYVLQTSLDFDKGGEIANKLFQLYEYVKYQVLSLSKGDESANIESAAEVISEILNTWKTIK